MNEILKEMKEICDVWVKIDGNVISYTQNEINLIYEYIKNLEQALDKIEKYVVNLKENCIFWENDDFTNGRNAAYEMISDDLLKIIQKAKGDVKNENKNI